MPVPCSPQPPPPAFETLHPVYFRGLISAPLPPSLSLFRSITLLRLALHQRSVWQRFAGKCYNSVLNEQKR